MAIYPVDLHSHTTASDGTLTPTQLVKQAKQQGLQTLGIADHDTIDGLAEARHAGQQLGVEIVPAIEFSTRPEPDKEFIGIHLLGYFISPNHPTLAEILTKVKQGRIEQKIRQIEKMRSFGFDITVDEVLARAKGMPGRPHIAAAVLAKYPHKFETVQQIFDEYLGSGAKAHVKRLFALTVGEAIDIVKQVGGLPVFAHPGVYDNINPIVAVRQAKAEGVEGVEVFYAYKEGHYLYDKSQGTSWVTIINDLADELGLLKTGGTDFHGRDHETVSLGDTGLTVEQFTILKQGWQQLRR